MKGLLITLAGAVVAWAGNEIGGLWWFTFAAGLVLGLVFRRAAAGALWGGVAGFAGWGFQLLLLALSHPLGRAAAVISGVMGFGSAGGAPALVLTLLVGLLLGTAGGWLGGAAGALAPRRRTHVPPAEPGA